MDKVTLLKKHIASLELLLANTRNKFQEIDSKIATVIAEIESINGRREPTDLSQLNEYLEVKKQIPTLQDTQNVLERMKQKTHAYIDKLMSAISQSHADISWYQDFSQYTPKYLSLYHANKNLTEEQANEDESFRKWLPQKLKLDLLINNLIEHQDAYFEAYQQLLEGLPSIRIPEADYLRVELKPTEFFNKVTFTEESRATMEEFIAGQWQTKFIPGMARMNHTTR